MNVGEDVELKPLLEIETSELPAVLPDVGSVATPIAEAKADNVFEELCHPINGFICSL